MFCSASSIVCEINGCLSADQVSGSPAKRMLDVLCDTLAFNSTGHQKSWPRSHSRQPQTLTLWTVFCSLDHRAKQVRAYVTPFHQEWCMPRNMQAAPVNKDFPRYTQRCITFYRVWETTANDASCVTFLEGRCEHVSIQLGTTISNKKKSMLVWRPTLMRENSG